MLLQEGVEFHSGFKAEQLPYLGLREALCAVSVQHDGLQGGAFQILTGNPELGGHLVWKLDRNSHVIAALTLSAVASDG